jgi:hypothetical protein
MLVLSSPGLGTRKRGEVAWEIGKRQKSPELPIPDSASNLALLTTLPLI